MTKDEMRTILSKHLAKFREWSYAELAQYADRRSPEYGCLERVEKTAADGTSYQVEIEAFWDDKPHGDVRVYGDITAEPQRPLWGFIPIFTPDVSDGFIMSPDGRFVGEEQA